MRFLKNYRDWVQDRWIEEILSKDGQARPRDWPPSFKIEAEEYLKDLLKKSPKYVQAYITYGNLKENHNEVEDAEYYYRTGLKIAKESNDTKAVRALEDYLDELE